MLSDFIMAKYSKPKVIDLFAGPGGLSLGLTSAGFEVIAAVELDSDAGKTYRNNIGNHTEIQDITKFKPKLLHKKLINSGFKFLYALDESIKETAAWYRALSEQGKVVSSIQLEKYTKKAQLAGLKWSLS